MAETILIFAGACLYRSVSRPTRSGDECRASNSKTHNQEIKIMNTKIKVPSPAELSAGAKAAQDLSDARRGFYIASSCGRFYLSKSGKWTWGVVGAGNFWASMQSANVFLADAVRPEGGKS